jgi:hypothetical protein
MPGSTPIDPSFLALWPLFVPAGCVLIGAALWALSAAVRPLIAGLVVTCARAARPRSARPQMDYGRAVRSSLGGQLARFVAKCAFEILTGSVR